MLIFHIIQHTPLWVWIIFVLLVKRVRKACKESEVNIIMLTITPLVFMVWGLEKVIVNFEYPVSSVLIYIVMLAMGLVVGYFLYKKYHIFYIKQNNLWRKKSYLSFYVLLINFFAKYTLNVCLGVNVHMVSNLDFNLVYSCISGSLAGVLIGGILNTLYCKKFLQLTPLMLNQG